jgi:hypothetical protein
VWAWTLLERTPDFVPGLGAAILALGSACAIVVAIPAAPSRRRISQAAVAFALVVLLAGPAAFAFDTMGTALAGGDPSAGPEVAGSFGGPGGSGGFARPDGTAGVVADGRGVPGGPGGFGPGGGGIADTALIDYLVADQGDATWLVAVSGSGSAAPIQLATGLPVMAMGGFNGSDDAPTLEWFQAAIASGQLRFVLVGDGGGFGGGPGGGGGFGGSSEIDTWVSADCSAVDVGSGTGGTLYDCARTGGV